VLRLSASSSGVSGFAPADAAPAAAAPSTSMGPVAKGTAGSLCSYLPPERPDGAPIAVEGGTRGSARLPAAGADLCGPRRLGLGRGRRRKDGGVWTGLEEAASLCSRAKPIKGGTLRKQGGRAGGLA
jgi:hypothetical protein